MDAPNARFRARGSDNGSGRVYTVTITCTDTAGNTTRSPVTLRVTHDP